MWNPSLAMNSQVAANRCRNYLNYLNYLSYLSYLSPNTSCMSNSPRSRPRMKRPARRAPSA